MPVRPMTDADAPALLASWQHCAEVWRPHDPIKATRFQRLADQLATAMARPEPLFPPYPRAVTVEQFLRPPPPPKRPRPGRPPWKELQSILPK